MSLETFKQRVKYSSAGYPSKKDVNRFLSFLILVSDDPQYEDNTFILPNIPERYRRFLFIDLHAKHYYTFAKRYDDTIIFKVTKPLKQLWLNNNKLVIKKKGIRYMTCPLIEELLNYKKITKLRHIEKHYKHFSNTSRKVFKQVVFEFLPLHQMYAKSVVVDPDHNVIQIIFNNWIINKHFLVHKMLKRKLSFMYSSIRYDLIGSKLFIYDIDTINFLRGCT